MAIEDYTDMLKNTSWLLSANTISRIFTAVFIILLANYLLPSDFGIYNFAFSTAFIISVIPEFGFDALTVKKISRDPTKIPEMISDVLTLRTILSFITIIFLWGISEIFLTTLNIDIRFSIILLAFLALFFEKLSGAFFAVFRAKGKMSYQSYIIVLWKIIYLIFGISGILLGYGLFKIIMLILGASIFQFFLSFSFYSVKLDHNLYFPDISRWKSIIFSAYPFALFSLLNMIYGHITIVLISVFEGSTPTGLFSAGWKLIVFLGVIPHSFGRALFPFFTNLYSSNPDSMKKACIRSTRNLLQVAVPITVVLYLITSEVVNLLFTGYEPTINVFRLLVWMIPFLFMNGSLRMVLWSTDQTIETSKNLLYSSLFLIISGIILINEFGIIGAAGAVVSAEILYFTTNYLKIKVSLGNIWSRDLIITAMIAFISMIFMLFNESLDFIPKYLFIPIYVIIYIAALYYLNAIKKEDIEALKSIIPF